MILDVAGTALVALVAVCSAVFALTLPAFVALALRGNVRGMGIVVAVALLLCVVAVIAASVLAHHVVPSQYLDILLRY